MSDDSHDFESVNINIEVLTSDVEKIQYVIRDLLNRVGVIEKQHSLFKYKIDDGLEERLKKIEFDINTSTLFQKNILRDKKTLYAHFDKKKEENMKRALKSDLDVAKDKDDIIKDTKDMVNRLKDRESTKFDLDHDKNPNKDPADDSNGNGDVPKF